MRDGDIKLTREHQKSILGISSEGSRGADCGRRGQKHPFPCAWMSTFLTGSSLKVGGTKRA